jgi:hypothetical protein
MWTSTNFKTYEKQFDFTSSGQGKPMYTALKIDDTEFLNLIEALDGEIEDDQVFQTIICDHCGTYQCSTGNWVAIRQFEKFIFFIPAFEKIKEESDRGEFDPPYSLTTKGAFWLTNDDFDNFKILVPELGKRRTINLMSHFELISLLKWEAPQKIFGDFPNFQPIKKNQILAVSELDNESVIEILNQKIAKLEASKDFVLKTLSEKDKVISVFLDDSTTTEWKALCKSEEDYELLLGGTFKVLAK